jgi:hypothetical protein
VDQRAHLGQLAVHQDGEPVDESGEMTLRQFHRVFLIVGLHAKADHGELSGAGRAKEVRRFRQPLDERPQQFHHLLGDFRHEIVPVEKRYSGG